MRILLDGTPLLGARTGIGRYTASLARALASTVDVRLFGMTVRGWRELRSTAPEGTKATGIPVPARMLRQCWSRSPVPPVELFAGTADVVHGTNFLLPPSMRTPGVLTVHDLALLDDPAQAQLAELVVRGAHRAEVICTPTETVAESVCLRLGLARERIVVTPLGVDPEWFSTTPPDDQLRRRHRLPRQYLVFVGADGPRKGLTTVRRALGPDLPPLVVAGPGSAAGTAGEPHTGYLPDPELRRIVAGARALVLPSHDEGFGLPALEALACGVPVVCSDIPALREVTSPHAFRFRPGDSSAFLDALREALSAEHDPRAGRAHAAGFTWRACAEATLGAYRRARQRADA